MDSNGIAETPADIRREIASLEKAKAEIDDRISALRLRLSSYGSVNGNEANLLKCSVLVIGAGGLGSPALLYLAACGIGRVGIVDHDVVELNNLHRQIIHTEAYIGRSKVESAAAACRAINSTVQILEHREAFRTSNALEIVRKYDIVVDATDNVPSRYMISDCCVVLGKPLISGAALGLEGQLTVYNYKGGPCYRCLFPTPPPTTACQRCADSGVLGVVPGVIGCLQALEAIKVAGAVGEPLSGRMLLFDALSARIRVVKIRGRSPQCEACGEIAKLTEEQFCNFDYEKFTQSPLSTSLNIPLASLEARLSEVSAALAREEGHKNDDNSQSASLYVICRRGNDSQRAVQYLHKMGFASAKDITGGLESWATMWIRASQPTEHAWFSLTLSSFAYNSRQSVSAFVSSSNYV
ncbi:UNVERIFIED_CONTAM: Adenylyltransferase and sulfurtransferase MOCS3 [Sesamum latifolium]|uniref:Adenylyltransferase and sulfurtransferase MOCS3 n=1 Tax=Sesamum latifolium TaxID=2727402 RepID=A0AAW2Y3V9_9LAMI